MKENPLSLKRWNRQSRVGSAQKQNDLIPRSQFPALRTNGQVASYFCLKTGRRFLTTKVPPLLFVDWFSLRTHQNLLRPHLSLFKWPAKIRGFLASSWVKPTYFPLQSYKLVGSCLRTRSLSFLGACQLSSISEKQVAGMALSALWVYWSFSLVQRDLWFAFLI